MPTPWTPTAEAFRTGEAEQRCTAQYVEIYCVAESFVGAQTKIHFDADYHTINGTDYNDAVKFFRDDAGVSEDYNFNWYLDQYGNVIGATGITSNYAVLKDIIWITGRPGYAEATLVYMDGSEATVTVDSIDGFSFRSDAWDTDEDDTTPVLRDAGIWNFGQVSTDSSRNGAYDGYAMYRVDTNSDGSVNLEGKERYKLPGQTDSYMFEIEYANDVTLDINSSAILDAGVVETHVSNATQFLVNDNGTYTAYTGTANLGEYNDQTVEVFYHDEDGDDIADYVYIKTFSSVFGKYVFATKDAHSISTGTAGVSIEGVYVDGVETTILARPDVAQELLNNKGKLYEATWIDNEDTTSWRYGRLVDIELVSENTDVDATVPQLEDDANYLENTSSTNLVLTGNTLLIRDQNLSYNVTNADEVIYTDAAYEMTLADAIEAGNYGIWVVGNPFNNTATVYVGTKLEETNTITVTPAEGVADGALIAGENDPVNNTYTYTINDKNDNGTLDLVVDMLATSDYASFYVQREPRAGESDPVAVGRGYADDVITLNDVQKGDVYKVWVTTECNGVCTNEMWTINVTGWNIISGAVDKIAYGGVETELKADITAYYDYGTAVANAQELSIASYNWIRVYGDNALVVTNDEGNYPATYMTFTTSAQAAACTTFDTEAAALSNQTDGTLSYQVIDVSLMENNQVIVIGFTPQGEGSETVYTAFVVEK